MDDEITRESQEKKKNMGKGILLGIAGTLLACVLGINIFCRVTGTQILLSPSSSSSESMLDAKTLVKINELMAYIETYFYGEVDYEALRDSLLSGTLEGLGDKYSVYYNPEEYQELLIDTTGKYCGIGTALLQDTKTMVVTITKVYAGTPAEEAGLMAEDVLLSVEDVDATSMELSNLVSQMRGEEGTSVHLEIYRPSTQEYLSFDVERAYIILPTVSHEMLPDKIGYIQIESFAEETVNQFRTAMTDLENQGMESLIIDLRYNGGGLVRAATQILDDILPEGRVVYVEDKNGKQKEYYSKESTKIDCPLVVLVNESTASASEIFAGAIKDFEYGTLIGTKTFGKGIVQTLFTLSDGDALKLTTSCYFTPDGHYIHGVGIEPDIELEYEYLDPDGVKYEKEYDNQIQKAIEVLRGE